MKKYFLIFLLIIILPLTSAAHYMTGQIHDALDGTAANDYEVVLWNPANGINDNLTDIIGPNGNSGVNNVYFIDCQLLTTACGVGDEIRVTVIDNGSEYITEVSSTIVTGAGYDLMPALTLNSPPNITLNNPSNFGNSSSPVNFSCTANDVDGNMVNVTLYGNWSGGWHANETLTVSGTTNTTSFTKNLPEGNYEWNCLITDNLSISRFAEENFTMTVDSTPPTISDISLNESGLICSLENYVRVNCTVTDEETSISGVIIEALKPVSGPTNYSASLLSGDTYYADILLNESGSWRFNCIANDSANNRANLTSTTLEIGGATLTDLTLSSNNIVFDNSDPIENTPIVINATIFNNGCGSASNFLVGFYDGDPEGSGEQIGGNQTITITSFSNTTINITWYAEVGYHNIFVWPDLNDSITETNETNNKANNSMNIGAWQEFYGELTMDIILGNNGTQNITLWFNESSIVGNVFITDTENDISWSSLQSIGRDSGGGVTENDFTEIDALLNMTDFTDSVSNTFTTDGNTPLATESFLIHQQTILNVPTINSTNTTNFITGILWDTSDSTDEEYNQTEAEDLVFVTKINPASQGGYGTYDYETTIPVKLRSYNPTDSNNVFIYFDLN